MQREDLIAGGFVPTTYRGQEGEHLTKRVQVAQLPETPVFINEALGDSEAVTEVFPCGSLVQFHIPDIDLVVGPVPVGANAGRTLIAAAIAAR